MKRLSTILISVVLVLAMALGMTACGDKSGGGNSGGNQGGGGGQQEVPKTPTVTVNVDSLNLVHNESVKVTATVANSTNNASFKLTGTDAAAVVKVEEAEANAATVTALADGEATLVVELEGATSVNVPVKVDGIVRLSTALLDQTGDYDLNASDDTKKSATIKVEQFMGADAKLEVVGNNDSVAELTAGENGTYTVTAKQAGVADVTITLSTVKEATEEPEETEQPETQAEEGEEETPAPEYEEAYTKTISVVCTDEWNETARTEKSKVLLAFKEVKQDEKVVAYKAYITKEDDDGFSLEESQSNGVLRVPAIHNRKPVVSLLPCQEKVGEKEFAALQAYFLGFETNSESPNYAGNDAVVTEYLDIYNAVKEVYLPCTLTEIPAYAFRMSAAQKIVVQEGNHIATIETRAFNDTHSLTSFNLQDCRELKTIAESAFENNGNAALSLTVPNNVEIVEQMAFKAAKLSKLEFELSKVDGQGNYVPGITLKVGAAGSATGTCVMAQIDTVALRNIKAVNGGSSLLEAAMVNTLIIGEDIGTADFAGTPISVLCFNDNGWGLALTFDNNMDDIVIFEGANNWMPKNAAVFAGVDNCGALFGTFAGFIDPAAPGRCAPKKLYIHKDNSASSWLQGLYSQNTEFKGTGVYADYTEWVKK